MYTIMAAAIAKTAKNIKLTKFSSSMIMGYNMAKSSAAASALAFRNVTTNEMIVITHREGWHVGPYDFPCAFTFDPIKWLLCR